MRTAKPFTIHLPQPSGGIPIIPSDVKVKAYIYENDLTIVNLPPYCLVAYAFREIVKGDYCYYIIYYDKGHIVAKDPLTGLVLLIGTIDELLEANTISVRLNAEERSLCIVYVDPKDTKGDIPMNQLTIPLSLIMDERVRKHRLSDPEHPQELQLLWPSKEGIEKFRWTLQELSPFAKIGEPLVDKTIRVGKGTKRTPKKQT